MRERALRFGRDERLVGVLSEAGDGAPRVGRPAVLVANVGVHHRIGPFRLWVELARALAAREHAMLRFDHAGLGDSAPRTESGDELMRAVLDVRDAMACLERRGHHRFVVLGFCSGVDAMHAIARDDTRVVGAAFLDGYAYPTARHALHRLRRLARGEVWRGAIVRRLNRMRGEAEVSDLYSRSYPSRETCEHDLNQMASRGARLLFAFTGGAQQSFNHLGQLGEMFPSLRERVGVDELFLPECDHLFGRVDDRERIVAALAGWVARIR
ncbi:MAG: alpha/beta hydrolase [Deltaproteobacteria bacterium]|nr:alpha/beta hydrolase [Deltaproteobacteria bacterium]